MKTKSACAYYKIPDVSPNKTSLEDQRRMIKDLADSRGIEIIADVTEVTGSKKMDALRLNKCTNLQSLKAILMMLLWLAVWNYFQKVPKEIT